MDTSPTIQPGNSVLLEVNGVKKMFVVAKSGGQGVIWIGKDKCSMNALVGSPWGSLFTVCKKTSQLKPVKHTPLPDWDETVDETDRDNSLLNDNNHVNQSLREHHIEQMKREGKSGDEIVAALLANSSTFHNKTEFSQEKYKRKKSKKHSAIVCAQRPTATAICEMYYSKTPAQIGGLRLDIMSLMLNLANVAAHSRVLVVENTGGLLTGAVAERIGGFGEVTSAYLPNWRAKTALLKHFNFTPDGVKSMKSVCLTDLLQLQRKDEQTEKTKKKNEDGAKQQVHQLNGTSRLPAGEYSGDEDEDVLEQQFQLLHQQQQRNKQELANSQSNTQLLPTHGPPFTSCLIAIHGVSPSVLLKTIAPLMAPCSNFAILYSFLQPLADAQMALRMAGMALNLEIKDTFWREHQVAPKRTHPMINMDHGAGYVLSGLFVPDSKIELGDTNIVATTIKESEGVKEAGGGVKKPKLTG